MKNSGKYQEMPKNLVKIFQTIWNVWKILNHIEHTLIFVGKLLKFGQNISKLIEDDWAQLKHYWKCWDNIEIYPKYQKLIQKYSSLLKIID